MGRGARSGTERAAYWDAAYAARGHEGVSWYEQEPSTSLELFEELHVRPEASVIDVGAGASRLVDRLVERGFTDLTVLDVSGTALAEVQRRVAGLPVHVVPEDLLSWRPDRRFDVWHDRAVFHFLVREPDRTRYLRVLRAALRPGGLVVLGAFAADGPETCSGLPVARYSSEGLVDVLGPGFELVDSRRQLHTTPRGSVQPFTWVAGRIGSG